jgi:ABC-type nitrate/sulfonate/bicarbonate transport system permease component
MNGLLGRRISSRVALEILLVVTMPLITFVVLLGVWLFFIDVRDVPAYVLPRPLAIVNNVIDLQPTLLERSWVTFKEAVGGFLMGAALGISVAALVNLSKAAVRAFLPLAVGTNAVPLLVFAPAMVLIFGYGSTSKIAVVALVCFFPIFSNTLRGLNSLTRNERELLSSIGMPSAQVLLKAKIPAAAPYVFSALRTTAAVAVGAALVAEYFGAGRDGIATVITLGVRELNLAVAFAGIVVITGFGLVFYMVVLLVERLVTPWQPSFRRRL